MAMVGAPQQECMGNLQMDLFDGAEKLYIKQEMAAIELCGIEAKQRYRVSKATPENKEGSAFLYITEESQCLERVCCSANRSLKLLVHEGANKDGPVVQTMEKPFSLQGCCFCRPSFEVKAGSAQIGSIEDPCRFCYMDQQVKGTDGNILFTTTGSPWQTGMCCPCCAGISFEVAKQGQRVGVVEKLPMDCEELWLKTNRFTIDMKQVQDPVERRMMLASAMLLDLAYFEQQK